MDPDDYKFLMKELRLYHTYTDEMDYTKQIWGYQIRNLNKKYRHGNWKNLRVHNSRYGGQIGYSYQVIDKTLPVNPEKHFVRFIRKNSNGLKSLGQTSSYKALKLLCIVSWGHKQIVNFQL